MTGFDERRLVALSVFALTALRLASSAWTAGAASTMSPPSSADASTAVLGGLAAGDTIAGLSVDHVGEPRERAISVELMDGAGGGVRIWVRARTTPGFAIVEQTDDYQLQYGSPRPGVTSLSDDVARAATHALAERIERAHTAVPDALR